MTDPTASVDPRERRIKEVAQVIVPFTRDYSAAKAAAKRLLDRYPELNRSTR